MFRNRTFKVLSYLILLVVFCTGQVAAAPNTSANEMERRPSSLNSSISRYRGVSSEPEFTQDVLIAPGDTIRISMDSTSGSGFAMISANGQYVVFRSIEPSSGGYTDISIYDMQTGMTNFIATTYRDTNAYGTLSISADGRFVAFENKSPYYWSNIFVYDRLTDTAICVSLNSEGAEGNNNSFNPVISADGNYVTFESDADNLVDGDTNSTRDVFVHEMQTGITTRISVNSNGVQGNYSSYAASISADDRYVSFSSYASNLVEGDTFSQSDVFVHDRITGTTERVSIGSGGEQGWFASSGSSISGDGRYVAFSSYAEFENEDYQARANIFVRDRLTGITTCISVNPEGLEGNSGSFSPSVSADGMYVTFSSSASDLVNEDSNNSIDVFVRDMRNGTTTQASINSSGIQGDLGSISSSISADGQYVAFTSEASNLDLINGDTNGMSDVFVHRMILQPDSDGDGLLDIWETDGLIVNVNGFDVFLDLPAMGADPAKKDIFVEIDYMVDKGICLPLIGCSLGHSHQPKKNAIEKIVQSFVNAPVSNPDGSTGINLHVDFGPESEMDPITHVTWGARSQANELPHTDYLGSRNPNGKYNWSEFDVIKQSNFSKVRAAVFHYCVFAHNMEGILSGSGLSRDFSASDFIVSLDSGGSINEQAGTFMHELGHNLGLHHGGGDDVEYKPNYLSIMNYSFQTEGLRINGGDGTFDYSRFDLPTLDENDLNETVALNGGSVIESYGTRYTCPGWLGKDKIVNAANEQIDWNCNGNATIHGNKNCLTNFRKKQVDSWLCLYINLCYLE